MQKQVKLPDGRIISVPEEATMDQILEFAQATMDKSPAASHEPRTPPPGILGSRSAFFGGNPGDQSARDLQAALTDPENRSVAGGLAGGAAGAKLGASFGLPGMLIGGTGGSIIGGFAGSLAEGKDVGPAMQEGAGEGLANALTGPLPAVAGSGARGMGRGAAIAGLSPDLPIYRQVRNPVTGQLFTTEREAASQLGRDAVAALDHVKGTPGTVRYSHGVTDLAAKKRGTKVGMLEDADKAGITYTPDDLIPAGTLDRVLERLSGRSGGAVAEQLEADEAVKWALARSHVSPQRMPGPGRRPVLTDVAPDTPWTPTQVDARMQGMQDVLDKPFQQQAAAAQTHQRAASDIYDRTLMATRGSYGEALERGVPMGPNGETIAGLNAEISSLIPLERAAAGGSSAAPVTGPPRIRTQMGGGGLGMQTFGYLAPKAVGKTTRLLHRTGQGLEGISPFSPSLAALMRLINAGAGRPRTSRDDEE